MSSLISTDKIKARHFHSGKCFIDYLCTINYGEDFGKSICEIYLKDLELKVEHQHDHATFLNLDITIKEGTFIYKLSDKRSSFFFLIVRMPHIENNIPQNIFYSAIKVEFLRIARSTLYFRDFAPKAKVLLKRMKQQSSKRGIRGTSLRKTILSHPESFQHFSVSRQDLLNIFSEDKLSDSSLSVCVYLCVHKLSLSIKLCV